MWKAGGDCELSASVVVLVFLKKKKRKEKKEKKNVLSYWVPSM